MDLAVFRLVHTVVSTAPVELKQVQVQRSKINISLHIYIHTRDVYICTVHSPVATGNSEVSITRALEARLCGGRGSGGDVYTKETSGGRASIHAALHIRGTSAVSE
jgi:hypothetical protein